MWRSEDEDHSDAWWTTASSSGWWTRYGSSSTEGRWTKSPGRGYKKWTDTVKVGESFNTKEAKAAAVARRGTEKASATVATMATRKQVQEALQRKKQGTRSRRAMPSSVAKSTKTNEQKKVRFMVPPEVPRDARISIEDLANFDEPDIDELERDGLHRALRNALKTQVLVCADEWLSVFTDYVGRLGNEQEAELFEAEKSLPADKELEQLTCENDVAEDMMSVMVKLAKDPLEPHDIDQPTAEWRDELRPVQGRAEDTDKRVKTLHTEMCEKSDVTSVEEGYDVERVIVPQNDETAGILKQLNGETSADLTALEKRDWIGEPTTKPRHSQGQRGRHLGETSMRRLNTVASRRGYATEMSQCCGSQPRIWRHKATSQEGVMNFMPYFEKSGTCWNVVVSSKKSKARVTKHDDQSKEHHEGANLDQSCRSERFIVEKCPMRYESFGSREFDEHSESEFPKPFWLKPFPVRTCTVFFPFTSASGFALSKCLQPNFVVSQLSHGTVERRSKCADIFSASLFF